VLTYNAIEHHRMHTHTHTHTTAETHPFCGHCINAKAVILLPLDHYTPTHTKTPNTHSHTHTHADRMGVDIPDGARIVLFQEDKFKNYHNELHWALSEYDKVVSKVIPVTAMVLRPHFRY
jgi:Dynein heavy chain, N-terminal region 1